MALLFDADTERVACGSDASLDNIAVVTVMVVFRPSVVTDLQHIMDKGQEFFVRIQSDNDITIFREYNTVNCNCRSDSNPVTVDVWQIMFGVDGGNGVAPHIYIADLGAELLEVTSYGAQQTPSTTLTSDAANTLHWGYNPLAESRSYSGDIARGMIFAEALSLGQCRSIYNRVLTGLAHNCRIWTELGYNGTGTQPDWSGNGNSGTVTGATVVPHAPLGPPFGFDAEFPFPVAAVGGISIPVVHRYRQMMGYA